MSNIKFWKTTMNSKSQSKDLVIIRDQKVYYKETIQTSLLSIQIDKYETNINLLHPTPNFYATKSFSKVGHRVRKIGIGRKTVYEIDPRSLVNPRVPWKTSDDFLRKPLL